jgi:hypothetical protein
LVAFLGGASRVFAGNDQLSQSQTITTGERVAYYLQSQMIIASGIQETKDSGDLLNPGDVLRVAVTYEPARKVIELSAVGNRKDVEKAQERLEALQKVILKLNKKIQGNFGVTLALEDLSMDYLDAKTGKIILKFRDGKFLVPGSAPQRSDETTPGTTPIP